ncbi:uncharacterized protein LOC114932249 [Nylanderia fulva]|uniref:uncharacterized protein LOC114932249 n=1 Tax=Nylanderia fulva TaxID=613905 RepID=UPI0010FAF57E|nr:uncharacterized protein LOC114932249 [Nylanderia fulva]
MPTEITSLPEEVITIILGYSEITIEDVINFRCVCKRFQYAAKYDKFFEKKLFERWPSAKMFYDKYKENEQKESEGNVLEIEENINFIQTGINCEKLLRYNRNILRYKMSHYTKLYSVGTQLKILLKTLGDQRSEEIFTLLAQYFQPRKDVRYSDVKTSLDRIAQGVLDCLKKIHPHHSIFSTSTAIFSYWENNNIDDNHWNETESVQIMDTLQEYIFGKLNFRSCKLNDSKLEYMCIDNVLQHKFGQEVIVLIIYRSVAKRLGLRCDILLDRYISNDKSTYCLYWKLK